MADSIFRDVNDPTLVYKISFVGDLPFENDFILKQLELLHSLSASVKIFNNKVECATFN